MSTLLKVGQMSVGQTSVGQMSVAEKSRHLKKIVLISNQVLKSKDSMKKQNVNFRFYFFTAVRST